jgi:hypothetical protein
MPLRNELFGVFKTMTIGTSPKVPILASTATQERSMEVAQKNYIQGTAESRILDIGLLSESISIEAPILIGPASAYDGRNLLNTQISQAAQKDNTSLPILQSASINIDAQSGGNISLKLKSDGQRSQVFEVTADTGYAEYAALAAAIDPTQGATPSRVARNYDFYVVFGPYEALVQKASISVEVETTPAVFLGGILGADDPNLPLMGTQFPYLGVSGIKVSGQGTAAVLLTDGGTDYNNPQDATTADPLTLQYDGGDGVVTLQPGHAYSTTQDFQLKVFDDGAQVDLFEYNGTPLIDLSKAVINSTGFNVSTGLLTVNFGFTAWVKIA